MKRVPVSKKILIRGRNISPERRGLLNNFIERFMHDMWVTLPINVVGNDEEKEGERKS